MTQVLWEQNPTARQYHTCTSCGRTISPGETYWRTCLVGDDGLYTFKTCAHCNAFVDLYLHDFCPDPHEGWQPDDIAEWEPDTDAAREHQRRFLIQWCHGRDLYPIPGADLMANHTAPQPLGDHPHNDPGDGRTECDVCGKWVFECIHSCKRVPVTEAARRRWTERE